MRQKTATTPKRHSRRRRKSRGPELFLSFMMFVLTFILIVVLIVGCVFGYRFLKGSRIKDTPLETSRGVVPETLAESDE